MSSLIYSFGLILGILLIYGDVGGARAAELLCYRCEGDACESPASLKCPEWTDGNDKCFILFDETISVIRMGCRSELDESEYRDLVKWLLLCEGDNCNDFGGLPSPNTCILCNSESDTNCETNPSAISSTVQCQTIPHTQCYSSISEDGHTARGCLQTLEVDDLIDCLDDSNSLCRTCAGNSCNNQIFQDTRLSCYHCNSADDSNCEGKPQNEAICQKYSANQTCITTYSNDITQRGCSSEITCDPSSGAICKSCSTPNCNVENLKRLTYGNPGVWQNQPLTCNDCSGDDCATSSLATNVCGVNQYCVTVFGEDNTVVRRGCSEAVEQEFSTYCDGNSNKCFICNSNACNTAQSLDDYIDCIYCDSRTNPNCVLDVSSVSTTRLCLKSCMTALWHKDVTDAYVLLRTCLDDKESDDRVSCGSNGSLCKMCDTQTCNVEDPVEDRLECNSCLGDSCENPVSQKCVSYSENDTCFILFDNLSNVERMGCTSELEGNNVDNLLTCSGQNCNDFSIIPQPQTCMSCSSSSDVRCATSPSDIPTVATCTSLPHVECYTRVLDNGRTARGCVSDLTKDQREGCFSNDVASCTTCKGDKCNAEIFPEDRLRCLKCDSVSDPTCHDAPNESVICPIYSADEVCSSKLVDDDVYRGCGDDFTCDDTDKQYCKLCKTTNCNRANLYQNNIGYPGLWQDPQINCYTCYGDECDEDYIPIQTCVNNKLQNCVTVFSTSGKVVQRGCSDLIYAGSYDQHCDSHPDLCTYCKSSGCNNAASLDNYVDCIFCDSSTNSDCTDRVDEVSRRRKCLNECMTVLYPQSGDVDPAYGLVRTCLDDMDLDERNECKSGSNDFCKACNGENCNVDQFPEDRLSCLSCSGEACEEPQERLCASYQKDDRCFILYDDSSSVARMGCKSELSSTVLTDSYKRLQFCEGPNCNDYSIIPTPRSCLVCDSEDDVSCATRPDTLVSLKQCTDLPYTACYTRIEDGLTKRGCLSDIETDTLTECIENGDIITCRVCDSDSCNTEVYPADRQQCHRCSSIDDADCQGNPKSPGVCPIYRKDDLCVVTIADDTTIRGCTSEVTCNPDDRATCRICPDDNCNFLDILSNYVGNPGRWQELPLSCYECDGENCKNSLGSLNVCSSNNLQNCATVFDSSGVVIKRGCSDNIAKTHEDYCDENVARCQFCKSSACNKATSLEDFKDCVFCDSATNPDCVLNPEGKIRTRKCLEQCMVALYPKTSEEDPSYDLTRSCLDDKDEADRQTCSGGSDDHCKACEGAECNKFALPEDRHECYKCQGDDCEDANAQKCLSYHPNDQCYILFDPSSTIIAMGCRSEFEQSAAAGLVQSKNLLLCDGKLCNGYESVPNAQSCVICDSSTDTRCATNPNLIPDVATCSKLPYTGCYTRINEDGSTVRGCQADLPDTLFYNCFKGDDPLCSACTGNNCNNEVYPSNRPKCHRCNSIEIPTCAESPASNSVCPIYVADETCVVSYKDDVTYRGCSSELSCDESKKINCRVCSGSACNNQNLEQVAKDGKPGKWQDLPINCYTCEGDDCADTLGLIQACVNNNLQNCMTVFNSNGVVVQRGCSDPVTDAQETYCDDNPNNCYRCNSNGCNRALSLDDFVDCVLCDTSTNPSCVTDPSSQTRTRKCYKSCMTALYPRTAEENPSYDTTRTCLDDKDLDDRETCQKGSDNLCKACDGEKCNIDDIPADRRSCYQCKDDECQLPEAGKCSGYRPNDQCFILFDETRSVIEMGCKSDLTEAQAVELVKNKLLFLCNDDNCNDIDALPDSQPCTLCNSRTDVNCAVDPEEVQGGTTCSLVPYPQCYTRVLSDGATERGCLSNLFDDEFYDCLTGKSDTCSSCSGGYCNKQIYPEDRRKCYICDSASDSNCEAAPDSISVCPKYESSDTCVTQYNFGTTTRDCGTSLQCDASNRRSCRVCTSSGCNTVNLAEKNDKNYGKWQDLPLTCHHCKGDECQSGAGDSLTCENNNEQDCSTIFDEEGKVVRRGCSDLVEVEYDEYCDEHSDRCFNCKSNDCNTATELSVFSECVYCDSNSDATCVTDPSSTSFKTRQCQGGCMVALYPSDSSANPSYDLIRTCLNDKDDDDRQTCSGGSDDHCKSCEGAGCNTFAFPEDRHECYKCQGDNCEDAQAQQCLLYHPNDQCYILFDPTSTVTAMGCRSEFEESAAIGLVQSKNLLLCNGKLCNTYESIPNPKSCAVCDSSTDTRCATNPNLISDATTCSKLPYTGCFTRINEYGDTMRGCQADLPDTVFYNCLNGDDPLCSVCADNQCNREVYPSNRLQCHRCNSAEDPLCAESPASNGICPIYAADGKCVVSYKDDVTYRGCSTELSCDESDRATCRVCSGSACNIQNLEQAGKDGQPGKWQDLPINCYTCEGDDCADTLGLIQACVNNNLQNCMTVFNSNGVVVQRGCSDPVTDAQETYCDDNPNNCYRCNSNGCNRALSLDDFVDCVLCDTSTNPSCVTDPSSQTRTRKCYKSCMTALYPRTAEENPSYDTTRTCLDDKDLDDRETCQKGSDNLCKACDGEKCNIDAIPADRRSCYQCKDDECQLPEAGKCSGYRPNDQCFILFDETRSVIEMGCKSDLTETQAVELVKNKLLFLCDDDNCNDYDALPDSQPCALCNSRTDVNCAVDPEEVQGGTTCSLVPYPQCYTRVLSDGATERGCLSNLVDDEFYDCLTGKSDTCSSCSGGYCNKQIYPEDRRKCYICDSESDPDCEAAPDSLSVCPKYDSSDTCVTQYNFGTTTRDCGTSLQCDASNRRSCRVCTSSGCNTVNLAEMYDNNYGKWQDLPLTCHHCKGDECQSGAGDSLTCENNNEQDCSTIFDEEGKVVRRGCSDLVEVEYDEYCDEHSDRCFNCKSNDCNTATELSIFSECVYCDSNSDATCVTDPSSTSFKARQCQGGCMVALYPSDSSTDPAYDLIRTCLNDKELADQKTCTDGKEPFCKSCPGGKCNTEDLPEDRLRCITCLGDSCEDPVSKLCPLYKKGDQCFIKFDIVNTIEEMGCLTAFGDQEVIDILKTKQVYICEGENCNALDKLPGSQKCAVCDSKTDVNCAINPALIGEVKVCSQLPYSNCYTKVSVPGAGTTHRGCLMDLPSDDFAQCILSGGEQCSACVGDGCNKEIFPENRLRCHLCSSDTDPDCETLPLEKTLSACPYIRDSEKCVTALGGDITERGCTSQILCDSNDPDTCRLCDRTSCNTLDLVHRVNDGNYGKWQELPLKCHKCTGEECLNSLGSATNCTSGDRQDCMTVFDTDGNVVRRGCTYEVENEYDIYCRSSDRCMACKSNECNDAWEVSDYVDCVYCNSEVDSQCVTNPSKSGLTIRKCQKNCMAAAFTATNGTTQVIRTCLDDKEIWNQNVCKTDETGKDCSSCSTSECNTFNYPRDRLTCHVCSGNDCSTTATEHCAAYIEGDTCFAKYESGNIDLTGCSSDIDHAVLQQWKEQNDLYSCSSTACNSLDNLPTSEDCIACDSTNNMACATNPAAIIYTELCQAPITSCYSKITSGATHRGCLRALTPQDQDVCQAEGGSALCETCSGNKCNSEIYPSDRRRCHICSSLSDSNCRSEPNALSVCPNYLPNNECVVLFKEGVTQRGCSSDLSCDNTDQCELCGQDGCNVQQLDNGGHTIIVSQLLLTLLVVAVCWTGRQSNWF